MCPLDLRSASVQNWGGVSGDAYPLPGVEQPGVNEALAPHVTFASLDSFGSKNSGRDGSVSEYTHAHRFGRNLLLLRISRFYSGQELCLGLYRTIIIDQHNLIVQECVQRLPVPSLYAWFQAFSRAIILDCVPASLLSCARTNKAMAPTRPTNRPANFIIHPRLMQEVYGRPSLLSQPVNR